MKFIVSLLLIMLVSFTACLYLPWWVIALASFAVSVIIPQSGLMSFLSGFCALFLLWGILSFSISYSNNHILAHKVSLIIIKKDSPYLLMLMSASIGALVAGFAAIAGKLYEKAPCVLKE